MDDTRSDEALVELYRQFNDQSALAALLTRYQEPLWHYARKIGWCKDTNFIDDVCQEILLAIFEHIDRFKPFGPGSFRAWAYLLAQHKTLKANEHRAREPITFSDRYPEEFPDDLADLRPPDTDYHQVSVRLDKVLARLTSEERELFRLLSEDKDYPAIQKVPPFDKYPLAALRQKTCRLRRFLVTLIKEEK
jgi:RNA polymerase sigma factor (sigma-70 family)